MFAVLGVLGSLLLAAPTPAPLEISVFEAPECAECARIEREVLSALERELGPAIHVRRHSIEDPAAYEALIRLEARFGIRAPQRALPVVFLADRLLIGGEQIERDLRRLIAEGPTSTISIDIEAIPLCEDASCRVGDPIWLLYFHQPGCRACSRVEADLRYLRARSPRVIVESMSSYERLPLGRWAAARAGREFGTPAVFVGERALIGEAEIDPTSLEELVDRYRSGAAPFW